MSEISRNDSLRHISWVYPVNTERYSHRSFVAHVTPAISIGRPHYTNQYHHNRGGGNSSPCLLEALRALRKKRIFCYTPPQTAGRASEWRGERFLADRPPNALRQSIKKFNHRPIRLCECKSSSLVTMF
eukprot:scaffold64287_cov41-Cyclotella_meneghiniana.AAC.5